MFEQHRTNEDMKKPLPGQAAANDYNPLCYDPHRGIRFVSDQIFSFHTGCEVLGLPYNNPFSFFQALHKQLQLENRASFYIDGKKADPMEYRPLYIGLLLLYACYGDFLFCSAYTINTAFPSAVKDLFTCTTMASLRSCLHKYGLESAFRQMLSGSVRQKIYDLYPELIHHEELNDRFNQLYALAQVPTPLNEVNIMPDAFASKLFNYFLTFFKAQEGIVSDLKPQGSLPSVHTQRQRLEGALALRELADAFDQETEPDTPAILRDYTEKLCAVLDRYPELTIMSKPLKVLQTQRQASECAISERLGSKKAQVSALLTLLQDKNAAFAPKQRSMLQQCMHTLLHSFFEDPLYAFFENIYQELSTNPVLDALAPAYVWHLMSQYRSPIFKARSTLLKGANGVDFSADSFFASFDKQVRSEQRTSATHAAQDYTLFNALQLFFAQNPVSLTPDRPMNEYAFQRLELTQMTVYSDTGMIAGLKLSHPKPLFRAFALIYHSMEQMGKHLWQSMPHLGKLSVTNDEAEEFYLNNRKNAVMSFLLERAGNPPVANKKNLTARQCAEIVQIAFIDGYDKVRKRSSAQRLNDWMDTYFKQHSILQEFAVVSQANREKLMFAVFRLALERHAHMLARDLLEDCAHLFYRPIPSSKVSEMWQHFFTERQESFLLKSVNDKILLGELPLRSRRLVHLSDPLDRYPEPAEVEQSYAAVILACQEPGRCERYVNRLQIPAFFQTSKAFCAAPQDREKWTEDCIAEVKNAQRAGFSGAVLPTIDILSLAQQVAAAGFPSLNEQAILYLQKFYAPYSALLKHMCDSMGKTWCFSEIQLGTTRGELTQDVFRILTFWLAQDGASAVIVSWIGSERPYNVMDLANSLGVPILLYSERIVTFPEQVMQNSAIFALIQKMQ